MTNESNLEGIENILNELKGFIKSKYHPTNKFETSNNKQNYVINPTLRNIVEIVRNIPYGSPTLSGAYLTAKLRQRENGE